MSEQQTENPYARFLNLPTDVVEPDHYQLLKLPEGTADTETIRSAAMNQYRKLMVLQNNNELYEKYVKPLMVEVNNARTVLLDPRQKAEYDRQLQPDKFLGAEVVDYVEEEETAEEQEEDTADWLSEDFVDRFERGGQKVRRPSPPGKTKPKAHKSTRPRFSKRRASQRKSGLQISIPERLAIFLLFVVLGGIVVAVIMAIFNLLFDGVLESDNRQQLRPRIRRSR